MGKSLDIAAHLSPVVIALARDSNEIVEPRTERWLSLWNQRSSESVLDLYHPDVDFYSPACGKLQGAVALKDYVARLGRAFPRSLIIPSCVSKLEEDFYVIKWILLARDFPSNHAQSATLSLPGLSFVRFEGERIISEENVVDWWPLSVSAALGKDPREGEGKGHAAIVHQLNDSWNQGDVERYVAAFADEAWFIDSSQRGGVFGRAAIREYLSNLFANTSSMHEEIVGIYNVNSSPVEYLTRWKCEVNEPRGPASVKGCSQIVFDGNSKVVRMESIYSRAEILKMSGELERHPLAELLVPAADFAYPGL